VREGHLKSSVTQNAVYERGITNVVEINMRNLARWMDGVYDQNLLAGTNALSANIAKPDGYVVYVSDRRGDKVKSLVDSSGATINSTNGMVDNVDIYGLNGVMDAGEDVQARGTTVGSTLGGPTTSPFLKDTTELPDPLDLFGSAPSTLDERMSAPLPLRSGPTQVITSAVRCACLTPITCGSPAPWINYPPPLVLLCRRRTWFISGQLQHRRNQRCATRRYVFSE
jgi:hypothetical protein